MTLQLAARGRLSCSRTSRGDPGTGRIQRSSANESRWDVQRFEVVGVDGAARATLAARSS